jgi:beta-lactamase regulating signal transducer with metallopeptidase domain
MIAAWIIYSVVIGALLYTGGRALELVAHALNISTRFIWVAAITATVALSTRQLVRLNNGLDAASPSLERRIAHRIRSTAPVVLVEHRLAPQVISEPVRATIKSVVANTLYNLARTRGAIHGVDVTPLDPWNRPLLVGWFVGSAALTGILLVAFGRLREMQRGFEPRVVDGVPVAISNDVGPALFGIARPRIVLPQWTLDLPETERRIILAHEREHAVARDPETLVGALLMLVVQPWNVALWAMLSRLRLAIEIDCDRRVLGRTADARRYGELLVLVYSRGVSGPQPLLAFVERPSNLERRIRRITTRGPSGSRILGSLLAAGLALGFAAWTPGPTPTRHVNTRPTIDQARPLDVAFGTGHSLRSLTGRSR